MSKLLKHVVRRTN